MPGEPFHHRWLSELLEEGLDWLQPNIPQLVGMNHPHCLTPSSVPGSLEAPPARAPRGAGVGDVL